MKPTRSTKNGQIQLWTNEVRKVELCVPIIIEAVLFRCTTSKSRHWDRYADWLGFSLRGVASHRSLSIYIKSLEKKETCFAYHKGSEALSINANCKDAWFNKHDPGRFLVLLICMYSADLFIVSCSKVSITVPKRAQCTLPKKENVNTQNTSNMMKIFHYLTTTKLRDIMPTFKAQPKRKSHST